VAAAAERDRVGIGWRPELAAGILAHLDRIDAVEVIADDYFAAPGRRVKALAMLARQVPLFLHGVGLGLASASPVEPRRLARMARLVAKVAPERWSEHLAFVRADGIELGHLTAPPRNDATLAGLARNCATARRVVGSAPLLENVASLVDPPGSRYREDAWLGRVVAATGCDLLIDLHNLHANALNFGFDALAVIDALPLAAVTCVHLAGGRWIDAGEGPSRLLDDHLHAVPEPVYALLAALAARAPRPLTVFLERDGAYPPFSLLLAELERARDALAQGRRQRVAAVAS